MDLDPTPCSGQPTSRQAADPAWVLQALAMLGYDGIAATVRLAREQTGLTADEVAMRLGLPPEAVELWEQGRFIPRTDHLLRLGELLKQHRPPQPQPS